MTAASSASALKHRKVVYGFSDMETGGMQQFHQPSFIGDNTRVLYTKKRQKSSFGRFLTVVKFLLCRRTGLDQAVSMWYSKGKEKVMDSPDFEEIRQILREVAESQKETDRKFQETDRKFQETVKETKRLVNSISKQIGCVHRSIGHSAETYFQTALGKSLNFAGIDFDDMLSNVKRTRRGGRNCEFDMVLVNHNAVAIVDAKHRIHREQVEELATKKVNIFREFFPEYKDYKVYLGLAGFSLEDDAEAAARTYGVGLLKQDGNAIKTVDIPLKVY
jgi:hypothetical protein